ncbi:MAG: hypothetical protein IT261_09995 [Saprospiraceae bacterium]|nr:hypothetical protein [Saprospiraceae bacterium]
MIENPGVLPENNKNARPPVLYALVSNALQVYGIVVLGWHFFPILYMWWWEELILSISGLWRLKQLRPRLLKMEPEAEVMQGERNARTRFFLLAVYFVFIVVLAGFMFAPDGSAIQNILTIFFKNRVFNLNLLFFAALQFWLYWRDFHQGAPVVKPADVEGLRNTFDTRSAVIHAGLLIGALMSYLLPKYQLQTEHAFMFGFMAVKTVVEFWIIRKRK